jgi:hypothetical protein
MRRFIVLLIFAASAIAQTNAGVARHTVWGLVLPTHCSPSTGDVFALVSAGPAATYYNCTAVDTWTATGGSGTFSALSGDATSTATGGATTVLKTNGNAFTPMSTLPVTNYSVAGSAAVGTPNWITPTGNGQCLMSGAASYATTEPSFQSCPSGGSGNMNQAVANSAANTVSVSVGTSGTAFAKTPVTIDPSTGNVVLPSGGTVTAPGGFSGGTTFSASGGESAAPSTPAASNAACWFDSTDHAGIGCMANGSANKFKLFLAGQDCNPVTGVCTKTNGSAFTAASYTAIGTSGATIPLLSTANTWTLAQTFAATTNQHVFGAGSNLTTVNYPASSGAVTVTMPNTTSTVDTTITTKGLQYGGTGVDLSSAGGTVNTSGTQLLHDNASHVISSSALVTQDMPTAQVTRQVTFTDIGPVVGDDLLIVLMDPPTAVHLTRFSCGVTGTTSVIVNLVKATLSLLSADMTATAGDVNTVVSTTFLNTGSQCGGTTSCAVSAHAPVTVHIGTISGTPTSVSCAADYTVD